MPTNPLSNLVNNQFVPIKWTGLKFTYEFQLDLIGVPYSPIPGVYIFCKHLGNGNYAGLYVGETDNLWRRLTNELGSHHRWDAVRLHGATHISTLRVDGGLAKRLEIETDLRNSMNPPCNKQ
ncbi:hypothetical protein KMZ93_01280 [Bradyrhizobium sediminis]|uniref:GIY-YIG domain-containing protein n=1 Tax=Bradyrhizobium sediminis TaxID=2840469 RepID=A0A975NY93_9BRAD|nr:hypothetical protein [Bradyrhizobium sediminis]QWG23613.1 hypothetical protein KMZ93_01280 [Bradyrhizobium sediminis]